MSIETSFKLHTCRKLHNDWKRQQAAADIKKTAQTKAGDNMPNCMNDEYKRELCKILALNLPTLRTKANLSQDELADRLGFSRQTISAIENQKRDMQWSTFSALIMFFANYDEIKPLMVAMGIINDKVKKFLNL